MQVEFTDISGERNRLFAPGSDRAQWRETGCERSILCGVRPARHTAPERAPGMRRCVSPSRNAAWNAPLHES